MADGVFNIAKGAAAEMFRDAAANGIVLLLTVNQVDITLADHDDLAVLLAAANTEALFTSYARKTAITGTVTVDDPNERVDVDIPDQTWSPAGNGVNETMTKLLVAYENAAADATRVPLTHHEFTPTTDGSDLTVQFNASGFFRAA